MPTPPQESKVPWRKIRDKFAEILRYLRATKPIPGGLLEITPTGFKVPEPVYPEHHPQFEPRMYSYSDTSAKLFIKPGVVYGPYYKDPGDDAGIDRFPHFDNWPYYVNEYNPETGTSITLDADRVNLIWLQVYWANFTPAQVGSDSFSDPDVKSGGAGHNDKIKWAMQASHVLQVEHTEVEIDGDGHDHSTAANQGSQGPYVYVEDGTADEDATPPKINPGIYTQLWEHNWHIDQDTDGKPKIYFTKTSHQDGGNWVGQTPATIPENTSTLQHILAGFYVVDQYGNTTDHAWFLEGPVWLNKYPRVGSSGSDVRSDAGTETTDPPEPTPLNDEATAQALRDKIPEWPAEIE